MRAVIEAGNSKLRNSDKDLLIEELRKCIYNLKNNIKSVVVSDPF
jgi:hypothetical protein